MNNKILSYLVFIISLLLVLNPVNADTITVCPSGCNSTTIQGGINLASSGDTINIGDGTYTENVVVNVSNLQLNGNGTGSVTINASNTYNPVVKVTSDNVTINSVTIQDGNNGSRGWGIYALNINGLEVYDVILKDNYFGITVETSDNSTVRDSQVYDNANTGIYLVATNNSRVYNNTIHNNFNGISFEYECINSTAEMNEIYNHTNTQAGVGIIFARELHDNTAFNNTIHDNRVGISVNTGLGRYTVIPNPFGYDEDPSGGYDNNITANNIYNCSETGITLSSLGGMGVSEPYDDDGANIENNTFEYNTITNCNNQITFIMNSTRPIARIRGNVFNGNTFDKFIFEELYGSIVWDNQTVNLTGIDTDTSVILAYRSVLVTESGLNYPATVTLKDTGFTSLRNFDIYKDGNLCLTECYGESISGDDVTFYVTGFSNYTLLETCKGFTSSDSNSVYQVSKDINHNVSGSCFTFNGVTNITLEGNGNTIYWFTNDSSSRIFDALNTTNLTIKNFIINVTGFNPTYTTTAGQLVYLENTTDVTIANLQSFSAPIGATFLYTAGDISNLYIDNNTVSDYGVLLHHSQYTGNVYNTTITNNAFSTTNFTNMSKYLDIIWWTDSDLFTYTNNILRVNMPEYPNESMGEFVIHGGNITIEDSIYYLNGSARSPLYINRYGTPKNSYSNVNVDNFTITCVSLNGCEASIPYYSLSIFGVNNVIVNNLYSDLYVGGLQYVNCSNVVSTNNYLRANRYPYWIQFSDNVLSENELVETRKNNTLAGDDAYYSLFINESSVTLNNYTYDGNNSIYYGIEIRGDSNITINNSNISGEMSAIDVRHNSYVNIYNSELYVLLRRGEYPSNGSIKTRGSATANVYNTTMNDVKNISADDTSQVNVYWQLFLNNSLYNATVDITDNEGNLIDSFTDATKTLWLREFYVYTDTRTNSTPHLIEASKLGYRTNSTYITMNTNREFTVRLFELAGLLQFRNIVIAPVMMILGMFLLLGILATDIVNPKDYIKMFVTFIMLIIILATAFTLL